MNHRLFGRDLSALSLALLMVLGQTSFSRPAPDFDLGDPRGLAVLEQISHDASVTPRLKEQLSQYQELLRKVVAAAASQGAMQP